MRPYYSCGSQPAIVYPRGYTNTCYWACKLHSVYSASETYRATATGRQILAPSFVDREVLRGQRGGTPTDVNLSFLNRSRYFSLK
jgi:hypothetical protein